MQDFWMHIKQMFLQDFVNVFFLGAINLFIDGEICFIFKLIQMPKKNQKKEEKKPELQIVDEQKEPCLRGLQKKVRNINKKLTQIAQLEAKQSLKPQQLEKVDRKEFLVNQKQKYLEFISIYKDILADNVQAVRNIQLNELKEIATILAAREYGGAQLTQNAELDSLVRLLSQPSSLDITLSQRIDQINDQLVKVANNTKLKQKYLKYVNENPNAVLAVNQRMSNQPEPRSDKSQEEQKQAIEDLEEELHETNEITGEQPVIVQPHVQHQKVQQAGDGNDKRQPVSAQQKSDETFQVLEPTEEKVQKKGEEGAENQDQKKKRRYQKDKNFGDKDEKRGGRRNYNRGQRKEGQDQNPRKPRNFKPKYAPKDNEGQQEPRNNGSSSSSEKEEAVRPFKKEEKKKMEEEGFIFIPPKTKPKAREQKQWHDRQHGRKHHHHHNAKNE